MMRRRVSEAQLKNYTILTPGLSTVALAKEEGRKLHPSSSAPQITPRQGRGATSSTFAQGYGGQASKASGIW